MNFFMKLKETSVLGILEMLIEIIANNKIIQLSRSVCSGLKSNEGPKLGYISPSINALPSLAGKETEQEGQEDIEALQIVD